MDEFLTFLIESGSPGILKKDVITKDDMHKFIKLGFQITETPDSIILFKPKKD